MQRIIFVNLHSDWMLLRTMSVYVFKFSAAIKHGYILKYLLDHPNEYEVCNFINDRGFSALTHGPEVLMKFLNIFSSFENSITLKKNNIPRKAITIIRKPSEIRPNDIVIMYNVCKDNFRQMSEVKAFKALSMLHFHGCANEEEMIREAGVNCLFGEVDLSKTSEIYNRYYHLDLPWIVHPFVPAPRFRNIKPFKERKNKCFSTGTITYKTHPEFLEVYGDPCDQPARKFVMDNQEYFKDTVECYSRNYEESDDERKTINPSDLKVVKLYKKIYNRFNVGQQKKYFSFDMVEKFNEYKMHLLGEEIIGVPGIGFVEGMACGSAYIGIDSPMYRDYGLVPGVHYITYDGTKEGLRTVVEFWQKEENQAELEHVAKTGSEFVRKNFYGPKVAGQLLDALKFEQNKWSKNNK